MLSKCPRQNQSTRLLFLPGSPRPRLVARLCWFAKGSQDLVEPLPDVGQIVGVSNDVGLVVLYRLDDRPAKPDRIHHIGADLLGEFGILRYWAIHVGFGHAAPRQARKE